MRNISVLTGNGKTTRTQRIKTMLYTIVAILIVLWLLGFSFHIAGGFIHALLVIAVVVLIVRLVTGRAP
jgi:hypothetical protein